MHLGPRCGHQGRGFHFPVATGGEKGAGFGGKPRAAFQKGQPRGEGFRVPGGQGHCCAFSGHYFG